METTMNIKQLIRLMLKIPATPFVAALHIILILSFQIVRVFEWVYEASDSNKNITKSIIQDSKRDLKKWFTTV
jgi:hypothetical protein